MNPFTWVFFDNFHISFSLTVANLVVSIYLAWTCASPTCDLESMLGYFVVSTFFTGLHFVYFILVNVTAPIIIVTPKHLY